MEKIGDIRFPDPLFWSGKRVLATGQTGFKGSWLTIWLESVGALVCGLSLSPNTQPSFWNCLKLSSNTIDVRADIAVGSWKSAIILFEPQIAFHLAAQLLVVSGWENPKQTFRTNVDGLMEFLGWANTSPSLEVGVVITSDSELIFHSWPSAENLANGQIGASSYNLSPNLQDQVSVSRIVDLVQRRVTPEIRSGEVRAILSEKYSESEYLLLNSDKAFLELVWRSLMSWNEAVAITLSWYEDFYLGAEPRALIMLDINSYITRKSLHVGKLNE